MRNYWLKILLGALAVFAVGMVVVTIARSGAERVRTVVETTEPVELPIVFIPFRVDGQRLGDIDELVVHRSAPDELEEVELMVELDRPSDAERLRGCRQLAIRRTEPPTGPRDLRRWSFECVTGDSAPEGLVEFGRVKVPEGDLALPLIVPREVAAEFRAMPAESLVPPEPPAPPAGLEVPTDSLRQQVRAAIDSARRVRRAAESAQ